jgi:hypothetical protein
LKPSKITSFSIFESFISPVLKKGCTLVLSLAILFYFFLISGNGNPPKSLHFRFFGEISPVKKKAAL